MVLMEMYFMWIYGYVPTYYLEDYKDPVSTTLFGINEERKIPTNISFIIYK